MFDIGGITTIRIRERRRVLRRAVHKPAYASTNGSSQAPAREFSEIVNISESGACIQAARPMKVNCLLPLVLELSETGARIHTTGHVVWAESSGRTGIRFPELPEVSRAQLKEWMAVNEPAKGNGAGESVADPAAPAAAPAGPSSRASRAAFLAERAEIQKEVELCGPDFAGALKRIADRAVALAWAGGAAIALKDERSPSDLICAARAGHDSPELGARRDPNSGFSGECIRSGTALKCDDCATDPRDGAADFRRVGIRSLVACPIRTFQGEVVGILEVFSQEPAAFSDNDARMLEGLARIAAEAIGQAANSRGQPLPVIRVEEPSPAPPPVDRISSADAGELVAEAPAATRRLALLGAGICAVAFAAWLAVPWISEAMNSRAAPPAPEAAVAATPAVDYAAMDTAELKTAALAGSGAAQYALAIRYASGNGAGANNHEALGWFLKAADSGELRAAAKIASCFWAGKGTEQDYSKAYFWGLLAQAAGDDTGQMIVINSSPHLHDRQRLAEQQEADTWLRAHRATGSIASR